MGQQYLAETIEMRVNPARQSSAFLREEAGQLRKTLEPHSRRSRTSSASMASLHPTSGSMWKACGSRS